MEPPSKHERYFSGMPLQQDPSQPLPGEVPPGLRNTFVKVVVCVGLLGFGLVLGLMLGPEAPEEAKERIAELETELGQARARINELNRALKYKSIETDGTKGGVLDPKVKAKHEQVGRQYAAAIRNKNAQSAAELIEWFVGRWNQYLDRPEPDDLYVRRAQLLAQLVGAMRSNLDPGDYAAWQEDFFSGSWLAELHFDLDGDGFPTKRKERNPKHNFIDRSVCEIAMVINQWTNDAQIWMHPSMECESLVAKMSLVLQGRTINDAITDFVDALKKRGFRVVDKTFKGGRKVLVAAGR